jgi:hypothetical protein
MKKILSILSLLTFVAFISYAEEPKSTGDAAKTETVTKASDSGVKHSCCSKSASASSCSKKAEAKACTPEEKAACDKAKAEKAHSCGDKAHTEAKAETAPAAPAQPNK